ncbi:transmembrane protein 180 [Coregonus clupeaformis]|uniref:transmembrane protein 180 n=1 Tax=Coregonus clupeaformis TaxID=59861 RepID=UPI001BDF97DB|nr:transmembrane protein 180 [Coregonus clupeaformis]XP_041705926.1 transmembrane protein 180 [Coregonus clupeaformis]XP_041705995.1 transmembrane protein 180 [Coregonus clupeaformis]XP_045065801.1 transmembrane protein 180 [Coregonus clupeaformis]
MRMGRRLAVSAGVSTAVLYGSLALFGSILHNVFLLYYVETFVSVYKIDKLSFWVGEAVFLIWNSLNDPLFGWLSDRSFLSSSQFGSQISSPEVVLKRLAALSRNGPLFALSFLAFWVSWARPGIQFLVCLCLYDGFLTVVDLNHNALLADLAVSADDRTRLNFHCSLFSALGSLSVFLSYSVWDKGDFYSFRLFCVTLAAVSALGFAAVSRLLKSRFEKEARLRQDEALALKELSIGQSPLTQQEKPVTLGEYLRQLSKHRNFMWFASMNLVQVFHCHFNSNFFPLFLEHLLSDSISASTGSILLGISYIAPHLNNLYFLTLCQRYGVYTVIRWLFLVKLALSVAMLLAGADQVSLLCIFIASNRVFTEGTCKLLNLVITDLVDEDFVVNRRQQAASALLFGMVALVTKPGQTFAPLIGTWLLCVYTGYDIFERNAVQDSAAAPPVSGQAVSTVPLRQGCFYLLVFVPISCALLQLMAWSRFTLHGRRLQGVKAQRQGAQHSHLMDVKAI